MSSFFLCVCQVVIGYIWRKFGFSQNGKKTFNPILDPDVDKDHQENLDTFALG